MAEIANGTHELKVLPGQPYLFAFDNFNGHTVVMEYLDSTTASENWSSVLDSSDVAWTTSAATSLTVTPPTARLRLVVSGGTGDMTYEVIDVKT